MAASGRERTDKVKPIGKLVSVITGEERPFYGPKPIMSSDKTLRDEVAIAALCVFLNKGYDDKFAECMLKDALHVADLYLKEREKK